MAQRQLDLRPVEDEPLDLQPIEEAAPVSTAPTRTPDQMNDLERQVLGLPPKEEPTSRFTQAWNLATTPLIRPAKAVLDPVANWIDPPQGEGGYLRGFAAGGLQGVADLADDIFSPLGAATSATGMGAIKKGFGAGKTGVSKFLKTPITGRAKTTASKATTSKFSPAGQDVSERFKTPQGQRLQELTDKAREGTLTGEELKEAQELNKLIRGVDPIPPVAKKPSFTRIGENEKGVVYRNNDTGEEILQPSTKTKSKFTQSLDEMAASDPEAYSTFNLKLDKPPARDMRFPSTTGEFTPEAPVTSRFGQTGPPVIKKEVNTLDPVSDIRHGVNQPQPYPYVKDLNALAEEGEKRLGGTVPPPPTVPPSGSPPPRMPGDLPKIDKTTGNTFTEVMNFPKAMQSGWDMSFPLRQGAGLMHKKAWWGAWDDMIKSWGSEAAFDNVQNTIKNRPMFKPGIDGSPSFAKRSGLHLTDLLDLSNREEQIMSTWAEKVPFGIGKMTRRGNRAYTAFGNQLRADSFEELVNVAKKNGLNPERDEPLAKAIANFVNSASGRGNLGAMEQNAKLLNSLFFSPRLIASRMQIIKNGLSAPVQLLVSKGDPAARMMQKESLKTLATMMTAWTAVAGLAKLGGASVSMNPTSSDFGKVQIGNTRIDPAGGLQQYLVFLARQGSGEFTPSTGRERPYEMGSRFGAETRGSVATRFATSKSAPLINFAYELATANKQRPFRMVDRTAQMVTPLIVQDLIELVKEDPTLLPFAIPAGFGMGTQSYDERGRSERMLPDFVPEAEFSGGSLFGGR